MLGCDVTEQCFVLFLRKKEKCYDPDGINAWIVAY
jgi:hypothetical protein